MYTSCNVSLAHFFYFLFAFKKMKHYISYITHLEPQRKIMIFSCMYLCHINFICLHESLLTRENK